MIPRALAMLAAGLLAFPCAASAKDPLLSGYGGPGSGEQAVLGSELLPAKGGGGGDGGAGSAGLRAKPAPAQQPAATTAPALSQRPSQQADEAAAAKKRAEAAAKRAERRRADKAAAKAAEPAAPVKTQQPAARPAGAPPVIAYPSSARSAGGLPLSTGDLAFLAVAALGLALVGGVLRRLVAPRRYPEGPSPA